MWSVFDPFLLGGNGAMTTTYDNNNDGGGGGDDDDDDDDDDVKLRRWATIISTPSNGSLQPRS
jgi:hypothetical protein